MKSIKLINSKFPKVDFDNLKKCDKKTIAIVNKLVEGSKAKKVKLPLTSSIDVETEKTISVDVASLVRCQFAICKLLSIVFTYEEEKDVNGESFRVYYALKEPNFELPSKVLSEPKKSEGKRESSKVTKAKSEAKAKAIEEKESADNNEWNKNASMAIVDHLIGKYKIDCPNRLDLEREIIAILEKVR